VNDEMSEYLEANGLSLIQYLNHNLTRQQAIEWLAEYMQKWDKSFIIELLAEEVYEKGTLEDLEGMK
tara:strand:+ start:115 stop:315 length:201 start_codon:yes stop_codon:yes gene_type:complete